MSCGGSDTISFLGDEKGIKKDHEIILSLLSGANKGKDISQESMSVVFDDNITTCFGYSLELLGKAILMSTPNICFMEIDGQLFLN